MQIHQFPFLFHTFPFFVFFVVVFTVYWSLRQHRHRMIWLLAASIYFYAAWNPWLITLIVFSASVDYTVALILERVQTLWKRRTLLILSIGTNLALLAFFKYVNFFLDTVYQVEGLLGIPTNRTFLEIVLPLGISFYTFETISYIVDVYQRRIRPVRSLLDYGLYILFFPHLIAGPIVRPRDFLPQLRRPKRLNWDRMELGVRLFLIGMFKKILGDQLAVVIDPVFLAPGDYGTAAAWLAILGYAAQVYCDFSGYSDMAIGLAHMLGFHLPANFNLPYCAASIAEFWRRWHISLSSWLRDYLYYPLGGSRGGQWATCRNLLVTMVLCGLWHGANWTYIVFGLIHGLLLIVQRLLPPYQWLTRSSLRPLAVAFTFVLLCSSFAIFRCQTLGDGAAFLSRMYLSVDGLALSPKGAWTVIAAVVLVFAGHFLGTFVDLKKLMRRLPEPALGATLAGLLLLALLLFAEDGHAFIYFQF